jgi:DNA-nicking Smr family endonuclease
MPVTPVITVAPRKTGNPATLDASWDRQLGRGTVMPDRSVDLHGDTLARAYGRIDAALAEAIAAGDRVLLLVTGKPGGERTGQDSRGRGAIRAVVHDWLAASRHAARIAAVRNAHPRHGGAGALYVVLRRPR